MKSGYGPKPPVEAALEPVLDPGAETPCVHGCCDCCCAACFTEDEIASKNCYCGHPLCWHGRLRLRARGAFWLAQAERPLECNCGEQADLHPFAIAAKLHRKRGHQTKFGSLGLVCFPPETRLFIQSECKRCLGVVTTEREIS